MVLSSSILGSLSNIFVWMLVFALPIVVMTMLHMYLSLRRGSIEYGYLAGIGLFLLLQLALVGGIQPIPTLLFIVLLYPAAIKTLISVIRDATNELKNDSGGAEGMMVKIVTSRFRKASGVGGSYDSDDGGVDVLLMKDHGRVRGVSATRVDPATSMVQPQSCVTLLTALSKFSEQQDRDGNIEWVFKIDVSQNGGGADYKFMVVADGKLKKGKEDESEAHIEELVEVATLYLRSALRSVGLVEEDEISAIPAIELLKRMNNGDDSDGGVVHGEGRGISFDVVAIKGLPKKIVEVEEGVDPPSSFRNSSSSSVEFPNAFLQHPVSGLVRLMIADRMTGSYLVHFKKVAPPEGVSVVDESLLEAATLAANGGGGRVGDKYVRGSGARLPLQILIRNSVAGRLRLADGENLAGEAVSGVRRGYWNVEAYVAIRKVEKCAKGARDSTSPAAAAIKVASTLVSCFSGGARSVDAKILEDEGGSCGSIGEYPLEMGTSPHGKGLVPAVGTGEMSSDSLASFITLSPPYPVPSSDASLLAEFEIPPSASGGLSDSNGIGNGLLHLGRAYFGGTPVADVKIPVEDLAMHMSFIGETGFGKTTLVVELLIQLWDIKPELDWTILDLKGEYLDHVGSHIGEPITVLKPAPFEGHGNDHSEGSRSGAVSTLPLHIDLLALGASIEKGDKQNSRKLESCVERVFSILKESLAGLFKENVELSPMMEKILRESLRKVYGGKGRHDRLSPWGGKEEDGEEGFFDTLFSEIEEYVKLHGEGKVDVERSCEALKNRVDRFRRGILGEVCNKRRSNRDVGLERGDVEALCRGKVIIDLSECVKGGSSREDVRLLVNLIMEVVFESAFRRGLTGAPETRHLTIIEEANLLVPDVLHRRTMGDLTAVEDMILTARAFGEGLILLAQRPTISGFVLANAGTKVVFRTPFDSRKVGDFMGLNESQEEAVKSLRKFEAIVTTIRGGPYRVSTAKPRALLRGSRMDASQK